MENKKKISNLLIKKSQERLVKALDAVESSFGRKVSSLKFVHNEEVEKLNSQISEYQSQNRELTFALEKLTNNNDCRKNVTDGVVQELDETIESLEKILKVHHADN